MGNRYMDWTDVVVTPSGESAITLTETTGLEPNDKDDLEMWRADGHKFATEIVDAGGTRGVTIHGGDVSKLWAIPKGKPCTITAKLNHSKNRAGAGCITLTLSNAVREGNQVNGPHRKYATASVSFVAYSTDGTADPLSIAVAGSS